MTSEFNHIQTNIDDDVSLKKLLKSKSKREKKRMESVSRAAEAEMDRLCRAKDRLENMKKTLLGIQSKTTKILNRNHLLEESVVFVPVAKLREKF